MDNNTLKLDVAGILRNKAPHKKIPLFIINYLRRIAHEDDLNYIFRQFGHLKNIDFIEAVLNHLDVSVSVHGKENLPPADKKYIFASNHPLGGLDGMAIGMAIGKEYDGKVQLLANDLLMYLKPLQEMFIPVNKVGSQAKKNAEILQQFYDSDNHLITFPAGMCSRKTHGRIVDPLWQKNFIVKAVQHQRDIVPIYFEGRNSNFFYNLANIRKRLHIKLNVEMLYLADELFKQKGKHFSIYIGKPILWQQFDKSRTQMEWAAWVKEITYQLKPQ